MKRVVFGLIVLGLVFWSLVLPRLGGVAPKPGIFERELTLSAALDESERTGRPVLAVVTADWCGACQALKRGALSDPEVEALVKASFVPVYIDADRAGDDVRLLGGVEYLPTTFVIADGKTLERVVGNLSARKLLATLERSLEATREN